MPIDIRDSDRKKALVVKVNQTIIDFGGKSELVLDENDPLVLHVFLNSEHQGHVDLNNAFNHINAYPEEGERDVIERTARIIVSNETDTDEVTEESIVVVLRPEEYVKAVLEQSKELIAKPLCGELYRFYMVDTPDAMRALDKSDVPYMTPDSIDAAALNNVRQSLNGLRSDASIEGATLYYVDGNTFLTSSLVLLDEFWEHVEQSYGTDFVFTVPRKDQLFVFDSKHPKFMDYAKHMIAITFEEGFNLLSPQIFKRENGQIKLVE